METHHQSSSRLDTPKGGVWLALKQRESSQSFQKEPESSLNHHSINIAKFYQHHQVLSTSPSYINITTIWRQKRRQEWSHKWRRGNGHKDYVLVAYLYVVFGWGSTQLSTRLPDIEYYCIIIATQTRASLQEHHCTITRASLQEHHCQTFTVHHRTSIYQLCTADHYMSWSDTSNPPRSHLAVMLWPGMGDCSKNYWYGTLDWFCLW